MSTSTFVLRCGVTSGAGTDACGDRTFAGWHTHGESASTETSTLPNGVPARVPGQDGRWTSTSVPLAADRRRPAPARAAPSRSTSRPAARPRRGCGVRARTPPERSRPRSPRPTLRRPGASTSSATLAASDVLHARRARAGHPALGRRPPRGPAVAAFGAATVVDLGCGIGGDLVAFARAGLTAAGVDLDPVRVAVAAANLAALGLPGAVGVADALERRHQRRSTSPSPTPPGAAAGAGRSTSTTGPRRGRSSSRLLTGDSCVKIAPGIPHDAGPRRRRGRVGQRPRRGEGGRALGRPARHRPRAAPP